MEVEGCKEAKADWEKNWAWAKYDPKRTTPEELVNAINENTRFQAELPQETSEKEETKKEPPFPE
jgi:hypothetical protein